MFKENNFRKINKNENVNHVKMEKLINEKKSEIKLGTQLSAQETNNILGEKLLAADGTISRKAYNFSEEEVKKHKEYILRKEERCIRKQYKIDKEKPISSEIKAAWDKSQAERKSELMEMSVMIILHKALRDDYVVCRANKYDDYHGVDNVIVHKATGTVLCAFDDVKDVAGGIYEWQKEEYIDKFGPQTITYGFTFVDNNLVAKETANVPKMYLSFDDKQFYKMIDSVNGKDLNSISEDEYMIYSYIIKSLISQIDSLRKKYSNNQALIDNLDKLEKLVPDLLSRAERGK